MGMEAATTPGTPKGSPSPSGRRPRRGECRFCGTPLRHTFVDLGLSPPCQRHVTPEHLAEGETFYPLHVWVCADCWLVQLEEHVAPSEIFSDYAYFSSYSDTWLAHCRRYVEQMAQRLSLGSGSLVVELASNDGYLLQYFVERGVPVLGVEPAANVAEVARARGVDTRVAFFGRESARMIAAERGRPDLLLGNNVLAHVPDINDFVAGMKILLAEGGVVTMEFPHLERLVAENQFDTIYHEHFSYLSFSTVQTIFAAHGLTLFDVEELPTHGGSLRIFARHSEEPAPAPSPAVGALVAREQQAGMASLAYYHRFSEQVKETKRKLLTFLIEARREGRSVVGYGAPGKGNTLLNYCGVRQDFLDYTVDRSPYKQGNYLPGTRIPILAPEKIFETRPDYVLILPWNLKDEIMEQMSGIRDWKGQFVVPIPEVRVYS
jgi:SAM-dependent methyltransferase